MKVSMAIFMSVLIYGLFHSSFTEHLTLQQGLNEYTGCQDIHIGNNDKNMVPKINTPGHPALYTEAMTG